MGPPITPFHKAANPRSQDWKGAELGFKLTGYETATRGALVVMGLTLHQPQWSLVSYCFNAAKFGMWRSCFVPSLSGFGIQVTLVWLSKLGTDFNYFLF